jgi:hypothetical protein
MDLRTGKMISFEKGTSVHGLPFGKAWSFCLYGLQSSDFHFWQPQ